LKASSAVKPDRKLTRRIRPIFTSVSVAIACLIVGLFVGGVLSSTIGFGDSGADAEITIPALRQNQDGLTYGSAANALTPDDEPDLISVVADDNVTTGYVYKDELNDDLAVSPEEAVNRPDRTIPVYESDGKTVVGSFTIIGGAWAEEQPAPAAG